MRHHPAPGRRASCSWPAALLPGLLLAAAILGGGAGQTVGDADPVVQVDLTPATR